MVCFNRVSFSQKRWGGIKKIQENFYLTNWLITAKKQHRFARETFADIDWLIGQGKNFGKKAQLKVQSEYLWQVSCGVTLNNTDLVILPSIIEKAIDKQWECLLLNDQQWSEKKH